jgi:hypothetical protein
MIVVCPDGIDVKTAAVVGLEQAAHGDAVGPGRSMV